MLGELYLKTLKYLYRRWSEDWKRHNYSFGAKIMGKTTIGEDCVITGDTTICDSTIRDNVIIKSSVIEKSHVGEGTDIGPFAHLRQSQTLESMFILETLWKLKMQL